MKKNIKFNLWKFSIINALAPPIFFFSFNAFIGFEIPLVIIIGFSLLGSLLFVFAGAAMAALVLDSVLINDELENSFRALGRGSVKLSNAKRSFSPDFFFILLKDKENRTFARIPRPFWADDPDLIRKIIKTVENN